MNQYKIIQGDSLRVMPTLEESSFDLIVFDPPYARFHNATGEASLGDFVILETFFKEVSKQIKRLLKPKGACFVFCDFRTYPSVFYGFYDYFKPSNLIIWKKGFIGPGQSFRPLHELIIYFKNNEAKPPKDRKVSDIWEAKRVTGRRHPFEKPIALYKTMIENCSDVNDVVFDPFLGSGTTMEACQDLGRSCVGIEITSKYCDVAKKRCFTRSFLDREVKYEFSQF